MINATKSSLLFEQKTTKRSSSQKFFYHSLFKRQFMHLVFNAICSYCRHTVVIVNTTRRHTPNSLWPMLFAYLIVFGSTHWIVFVSLYTFLGLAWNKWQQLFKPALHDFARQKAHKKEKILSWKMRKIRPYHNLASFSIFQSPYQQKSHTLGNR